MLAIYYLCYIQFSLIFAMLKAYMIFIVFGKVHELLIHKDIELLDSFYDVSVIVLSCSCTAIFKT